MVMYTCNPALGEVEVGESGVKIICGYKVEGSLGILKTELKLGTVAHAFNPSTEEADKDESLSSKPACSTNQVPGQSGLEKQNKQICLKTENKNRNRKTT